MNTSGNRELFNMPWRRYGHIAIPILLAAFGGALRVVDLGTASLQVDELYIISRSLGSWSELLGRVAETVMGAPVEFFVRNVMLRFSHEDFFLRLPDAVFGTLSIIFLHRLASRLFNPATGLVAALLLAVSAAHIFHSRDARYYALFCMLSIISTSLLLRGRDSGRPHHWAAYAVTMTLGFYTCYFMAFVAFVHALFIGPTGFWNKSRQPNSGRQGFVLAGMATALAFAPWVLMYHPVPNIPYPVTPFTGATASFVTFLSGGGVAGIFLAGLFLVGFVTALRSHPSAAAFCLLFVVVPFPLIFLLDNWFRYFFAPRQMIFALPFFLSLAAYGTLSIAKMTARMLGRPEWQVGPLVAALVILCSWRTGSLHQMNGSKEDWRGAALYLINRMEEGDVLVATYFSLGPPDGNNIGWYLHEFGQDVPQYRVENAVLVNDRRMKELTSQSRVWVVVASHKFFADRIEFFDNMRRDFRKEAVFPGGPLFGHIDIYRSRP